MIKAFAIRDRILSAVWRPWLRYAWLAGIGFLVHLPALQGPFLWDDTYLARDNPFIKSPLLALEAFRHFLFLGSPAAHYRPAQNLSYMFDYYFWNTDAAGFHLTNILLHAASGLFLYRLLVLLFHPEGGIWPSGHGHFLSSELAAFLIAAIWIVHPVHSAAVDYISGRADSLAFAFAAGGWLLFLRGQASKVVWIKWTFFLLAPFCGLLALCSREIGCVWLALFLTHTFVFTKETSRGKKIAIAVVSLIVLASYAVLRQLPDASRVEFTSVSFGAPVRTMLMLRALGDYTRLFFWPGNLHMERSILDPAAFSNNSSWRNCVSLEYLAILGFCSAAAIVFACLRPGAGRHLRIFGAIWFFAAYLPISNIVELNATVAEHWLYLPSVGALIFLIGCILEFSAKTLQWVGPVAAAAILALGVRSNIRSQDWLDAQTFFGHTAAAGGDSGRVMINLAQAYSDSGQYSEAEEIYRRLLQANPHNTAVRNNLGCMLSKENKKAEAQALFAQSAKEALAYSKIYSHGWQGAYNYAQLRRAAGDNASAITALEHGLGDFPDTWELISVESEILRKTKGAPAALAVVRDFANKNWWHGAACLAEGRLYAASGDVTRAEAALRFAALLDVHDVEALNLLAGIYSGQNQLEKACAIQRRAIARQPDKPTEYLRLAKILDKMGREKESDAVLAKVSQMRAVAAVQQPLATAAN